MRPLKPTQPRILPRVNLNSGDALNYIRSTSDEDASYLTSNGTPSSTLELDGRLGMLNDASASTALTGGNSALKQRHERRGHTKSRRGCYNCKKRRIKPQQHIPLFSLLDMRFFQHFLFTCFPHQPIGNEAVWTHEIPCLAQNVRMTRMENEFVVLSG
ncbi:hypothetical protein Daesc_003210 [Daldinia eschscholtzii]|uniref:Uncharacterized protein n=1 Tax=Daldinia eschscholtzii TaxID=292717 RepID=A0AAX6MSC5_9PEZI